MVHAWSIRNVIAPGMLALGVLAALVGSRSGARAEPSLASIVPGYDISWPQCGKAYPTGPVAFAVIGINNGRPYTANPCFIDQYRWASRLEKNPAVYVNVDFPKPGRREALSGPYGTCTEEDDWCRAYNYGYGISREAVGRATFIGLRPSIWWLDVETNNYWTSDTMYNAQVVRGTIDYFKERKLTVGVYGTPRQWRIIAGDYAPGLPVWTAGAQGIEGAAARCGDPDYAFAGGRVHMVQYYDFGFDTNFVCPDSDLLKQLRIPEPAARQGPPGRSRSPSGKELPFWSVVPFLSN
ncbi:MAG: hypothetical protein C0506_11295 [Anaerolinea sp.]|nr:hypothetical protein [Anaerolinea sp.]